MEQIHTGLPKARFSDTRPNNVTTATICKCSGKLATEVCKNDPRGNQVYTEYFIKGTVPTEECTCHVEADICLDTGLLAGEYCTNRQTKVFITRPETETGDWHRAKDAEYMLISEHCNIHTKPIEEPVAPEEPDKPDEPENPEDPDNPDNPDKPDKPDKPDNPGNPGNPVNNEINNNTTNNNNNTARRIIIEDITP